jgi:hypothetical protein
MMILRKRVGNDRIDSIDWQFWKERINEKFVARRHICTKTQQLSTGQLFYQPQTPVIAMIKANKIITEAARHFLTLITHSLLLKP